MKIYFLSSQPCALSFNGVYFGITNLFERFAEISLKDNLFVEFTPQNAQPIRFFLTEEILFSPPEHCAVYLLPRALAIYARDFTPCDCPLRIITQKRFGDTLATVFQQGAILLSMQTDKNMFNATLPPSFLNCEVDFHADLCFISNQNQLIIYTKAGKQVFFEEIMEYSVTENTLNATLPLSNLLKLQAKCTYALSAESVLQTSFSLQTVLQKQEDKEKIKAELLPYLFFESLLLGADVTPYLSEELQKDKDKLRDYLRDFCEVSISDIPNVCALVYKKSENVFQVDYFQTEIQDEKIINIKPYTH